MSGLVRAGKLTPKVAVTFVAALLLFAAADPHPAEAYFIVSLCVIGAGELIRIWAAGHLSKNQELTTTGPYAYVKNPLYVGTFLITAGMCVLAKGGATGHPIFDHANWIVLGTFLLTFLFYYVPYKRRREGDRLRGIFGEAWDEYDRAVPDYFPRLTPYRRPGVEPKRWSLRAVCGNSEQWTGLAVVSLALAIAFHGPIIALLV